MIACVSQNREGKELAEIGQLVEAGAVAFSDDGAPVYDAELMRRAFEYCLMFDKPVLNHAEVRELSQNGVMHEGLVSLVLGLPGIPAAAEDVMVSRDIALAEATGGRLHVMHVSTANSVETLRRAKRRGRARHGRGHAAPLHAHRRVPPHVRFQLQDEPAAAEPGSTSRRSSPGWPTARSTHRQRPRPARQGKEDAGARPGPLRHRRPGNFAGAGGHEADRARPSRLARGDPPRCRSTRRGSWA